jgi:hypothetical protein
MDTLYYISPYARTLLLYTSSTSTYCHVIYHPVERSSVCFHVNEANTRVTEEIISFDRSTYSPRSYTRK